MWDSLISSPEYIGLKNRREHMTFAFSKLCTKDRHPPFWFTQEQLAAQFGVTRQVLKKQVDKQISGVQEPHCPPCLSKAEQIIHFCNIYKMVGRLKHTLHMKK